MSLVVLLRGVNVGGHRTFRPAELVRKLKHLGAVNIGAAGTFVIRRPVSRSQLRAELTELLPFETEIIICQGRDMVGVMSHAAFAGQSLRPDVVRFVSVLARRPSTMPSLPISLPASGPWLLRILARNGRIVVGQYRRHMKVIGYLGSMDKIFGLPITTRNWNTIVAIHRVLTAR